MSIEDQRRRAETALSQLSAEMSPPDFARNTESFAYLDVFLERFPAHAPTAWREFLELRPSIDELVSALFSDPDRSADSRLFTVADNLASNWCREWRLESKTGWMEKIAALRLVSLSLAEILGVDGRPESMAVPYLFSEREGTTLRTVSASAQVKPYAIVELHVDPDPLVWDMFRESRSEFRDRAKAEFLRRLDQELGEKVGDLRVSPDTVDVNVHWVDWFLLVQVEQRPIKRVASEYHVSRTGVRKGAREAAGLLNLNWHGTTP